MALINCKECGRPISDQATICPGCGCPVERIKFCRDCGVQLNMMDSICPMCGCPQEPMTKKSFFNTKNLIIGGAILLAVIVVLVLVISNSSNKLVCDYYLSNSAGTLKYKMTYVFDNDDSIKTFKGYQYAKPTNITSADELWEVSNDEDGTFNGIDGFTYNATYSANHEIEIRYTLDVKKSPVFFKPTAGLGGIDTIDYYSTKEEVKRAYESKGFTCK